MSYRDVLVITGGLAPQLVTETLFALAQRARGSSGAFRPREVVIIGTQASFQRFESDGLGSAIADLYSAWSLGPPPTHDYLTEDGDDIRTPEDATRYGTLISGLVRRLTADSESRLHLSLAGGRKTMTAHARGAIDLYGRPQDELSHVLVSPDAAERSRNFWFPTPGDHLLVDREGKPVLVAGQPLNARNVKVDLAIIPYVRLRDRLPRDLLARDLDYDEVTAQANMVLGLKAPTMTLFTATRRVRLPGVAEFKLGAKDFAYLQLLAEWAKEGRPGAGPEGFGGNHVGWLSDAALRRPDAGGPNPVQRFIDIYGEQRGPGTQAKPNVHAYVQPIADSREARDAAAKRESDNLDYFRPVRTHIANKIAQNVTSAALRDVYLRTVEDGEGVRFGISLQPWDIEIITTPQAR